VDAHDTTTGAVSLGRAVLDLDGLDDLFSALQARGYRTVGPTVRDGVIRYDDVGSSADLPIGLGDEQEGGRYRLRRRDDEARFGYAVGPDAWKRFLYPPEQLLWRARSTEAGFELLPSEPDDAPIAFIGVRGCDLAAIGVHDRVFLEGEHPDPGYRGRRAAAFVVAVDCTAPASTCFCSSMGTGPAVGAGFDLALTELLDGEHRFLVRVGSPAGEELLGTLPTRSADPADGAQARAELAAAAGGMTRRLESEGVKELLQGNPEHPRWDAIAERCLGCSNCTLVCPTCFCTTVEETPEVGGDVSGRVRRWDSCFTLDFSYLHGGSVRSSGKARYRQWLTHKLAGWIDQFGESGCVGCGRCIAWCPVGIDLTAEVPHFRTPVPAAAGEGA
jgi:ferredoxin